MTHSFPPSRPLRGIYHCLSDIRDRLNTSYFSNCIQAEIGWGNKTSHLQNRRKSIRLGSYDSKHKQITIHPLLDQAMVPRFCVEWVVYHEMLHQHFPPRIIRGRTYHHPPEFKRAETQFAHHKDAQMWFRNNLNMLLKKSIPIS